MLIPVLIGLAFPESKDTWNLSRKWQSKTPKEIHLELKNLLPQMSETLELAELYFNALEESDGDELDRYISVIVMDIRELFRLVSGSKTKGVFSLLLLIRRKVEKIPRLIMTLLYHSKNEIQKRELSEVLSNYEKNVGKDSLLQDILWFIREYLFIRWKWTDTLRGRVTNTVFKAIDRDNTDDSI